VPAVPASGVIGLLVCQVLEEEVAYVIARDDEVSRVILRQSECTEHFARVLAKWGKPVEFESTLESFRPSGGLDVVVDILRVALHMDKQELRDGVHDSAKELARIADVVMLGYGMCGNVLDKPELLLADLGRPIVVPRNDDGSIIDDCVCLILGGTERYLDHVKTEAGTWFLTPGWLRHWETLLVKELHAKDVATVKWIFDRTGYRRALMIDSGIADRESYEAESGHFASLFDFYLEVAPGSLHILEREMKEAKHTLAVVQRPG
jgi:hypothetical protein